MPQLSVSEELIRVCRAVGATERIYDCGSRDALDGLELLRRLEARELHFFECNPPSAATCRANVRASDVGERITVNELAVAEYDGETSFFAIDTAPTETPHADGNPGTSSLLRVSPAYTRERYVQRESRVGCTRLDSYAASAGPPDLLWMDLQGVELRARRLRPTC
jgi:FkbM family methyltransferase